MLKKALLLASAVLTYLRARVYIGAYYDRKWIEGRHFKGPYGNLFAPGWQWIVNDGRSRRRTGWNRNVRFPVSPRISVAGSDRIVFDPNDLQNFQGIGNYYQAFGESRIVIGKGCWIANNVGIITMNHDIRDPDRHAPSQDVMLGEHCWIGMNSVLLPGVVLGPHTTVGAGSIVTKSFPEGYCVIAGNPARLLKTIERN